MDPTRSSIGNPPMTFEHPGRLQYSATPAFRRHSDGATQSLPTPPALDHPSTIHQHPQSPYEIQTAALKQTSRAIDAVPNLAARGAPSRLYPTRGFLSSQKLLEQQEAMWYRRFRDQAMELRNVFYRESQERQAEYYRHCNEWYERCEKKHQELREKSAEIGSLIAAVLSEKTQRMKLEENFNIRGILELMVYYAKLTKKIKTDITSWVQAGLDELAKTPEFTKVLSDEVASRGLVLEAVTQSISFIYEKAFQHAYGNDSIITIYKGDYTVNEVAVLASFLRVQSKWPHGSVWREVTRKR